MNAASDYTILIVDDQVSNLEVLSGFLESHGFHVLVARDSEAALEIAQRALPDLILLDVILPGMNGFEVCRQLKADKLTENIPIMFITILEKIEDKIQGFQAGAADYITKPFQAEEVVARVTTHLRIRSLTRELQEANETLERRVEERTAQLAQVNKNLQAEVVERRLAEEALSRANEALTRVNRAYRTLSECNRILVYATEEAELLQEICQTIVEFFDYLRARIELVEQDEAKTIRLVVQADREGKHLEKIPVSWSDLGQRQVFSGPAIHTGRPIIYKNILSDPDLVSLLTEALKEGYASAAVFPLLTSEQETIGALNVYATQPDVFAEEEISLLMELATDLAFGVTALRTRVEHKQAEEALRASEKQFRLLAENSTDMISLHAPDGSYLYASPACKTLLGYEPDELVGRSAYELFHPADATVVRQSHTAIIDQPVVYTIQSRIRRKDGEYIWFETTSRTIRDSQTGVVTEIQAASRDITARKRAEEAEREQRLFATALVDTAEAINSTLDFDEVLERLLDATKNVVPHDGANIMLIDDDRTGVYVVRSCDCYTANGLEKPKTGVVEQLAQLPHLQQMIDTHEALVIPYPLEYAGWSMKMSRNIIRSYVGVPIIVEGEVIGILNVDSVTPGFFKEKHADHLRGFAHQAAIALQNAQMFQKLESYSEDLEQAVIERTLELTKTNVVLKKLSQAKDEFVSNVSHELKSPITTIALRHYLLRIHPENLEEHISVLERETGRLNHTIDDLLRLSRLDQGRIEVVLAPVDLDVVVRNLVHDRVLQAQQKGLTLTFSGQTDLPVIMADQGLLEQVLSILLTNAISYTPANGQITVRTQTEQRETKHWMGFSVQDTGLGILPEEQPHLFERFFQGTASRQLGVPGTGLGLSIAQEIIERHHGHIEIESSGIPGEGTTFSVWLPLAEET